MDETIHINLTRPVASSDAKNPPRVFDESFGPGGYTSALFPDTVVDDDELVIGYKAPRVELDFRANDLQPTLNVSYKAKWTPSERAMFEKMLAAAFENQESTLKPVDLEEAFNAYIPGRAEPDKTEDGHDATSKDWKPPGKRTHSFKLRGKQYEMWSVSLAEDRGRAIWENLQLLVILLIDGATPLELGEDWRYERWTLHLLYEVTSVPDDGTISPYTLAGCATSYRFWIFPTYEVILSTGSLPSPPPSTNGSSPASPIHRATSYPLPSHELEQPSEDSTPAHIFKQHIDLRSTPSRECISQFLILPPLQRAGLGPTFYKALFAHLHAENNLYEITVEDPNEAFDSMRDFADLEYLRSIPDFASLEVAASVPANLLHRTSPVPRDYILGGHSSSTSLASLRHKSKIMPRQFDRLVEMHTLSKIPPLNRSKTRIIRKEKSSNENDRRYYFWRMAVKCRIYLQNADSLEQMSDDPAARAAALEAAVDGQQEEFEERFAGLEKRERRARGEVVAEDEWEDEDGGKEEGDEDEEEVPATRRTLKRNRATIAMDEEDEEELYAEEAAASKKSRAA